MATPQVICYAYISERSRRGIDEYQPVSISVLQQKRRGSYCDRRYFLDRFQMIGPMEPTVSFGVRPVA